MWPFRPATKQPLGPLGENLAGRYLRRLGYKILARNYRCPAGEADIIALDTNKDEGQMTLVFVEVKSRRTDFHVAPESAIDAHKRRQMLRVAKYYLAHHATADMPARFDSVAVVVPEAGEPTIRHVPNAF